MVEPPGHTMRISITGTPGVGKTVTAEKVSTVLQVTHINISKTAVTMGAVIKKDRDTSVVDVDILRKTLEKMDNIVIDSHFAEVFDVDFVFVLRCEPKILYKRLKERGYTEEKIKENVMAEILDYCLIHALDYHNPEKIFEVYTGEEIIALVHNPVVKKSLAFGSRTHFLTEDNLALVE